MSIHTYAQFTNGQATRQLTKLEGLGRECKRVNLGEETYQWIAEIDQQHLQFMADKAAKNKHGVSYAGAVKVTITKREILNKQ